MSTDAAARVKQQEKLLRSFSDSAWGPNALLAVQAFTVPVAFWFKPICVCLALGWLIYRAYQVLNKPLDELAAVLGFDIPLTPTLDLASIKADGAIIHWTSGEKQRHKNTLRYDIHLNGTIIDTVPIQESAVSITGLQPSTHYVVRVALVNHLDFSSRSDPIRFRTKSALSNEFFVAPMESPDGDHDGSRDSLPQVRHYGGLKDIVLASPDAVVMSREGSATLCAKRNSIGRKTSDARVETHPGVDVPAEGALALQRLTEKLDAIRRETDDMERVAREEEDEETRLKDDLIKERDSLKAEVTEKEKASRNLKREVNTLERQNTAAQNERTKQERVLQQKKQERQKLRDEVVRWAQETEEMRLEVDRIHDDKVKHHQQAEQDKEELRNRQADEAGTMRNLDEEIRAKTAEMKRIDRLMKTSSPNGAEAEPSLVRQFQQDAEDDRKWALHRLQLQQQYAMAVQKLEAAKSFHAEQARYLESLRADRMRQEDFAKYSAAPSAPERAPRSEDGPRRQRAPSGQGSDSPRLATFSANAAGPFGSNMGSIAPFGPAPFLNIHNGMTIAGPSDEPGMSDEDRERLTGGAPMSPNAAAELLPADLFSGDGDRKRSADRVLPLPGLGALPGFPSLPGLLGQTSVSENVGAGPASPTSGSSRSPSIFASPRGSSYNLQLGSPEQASNMDSDRRSIRSTRSTRAATNGGAQGHGSGSRFSSMFGIKPRHKPSADEALTLGQIQSHSMPKQDQNLIGITSMHRKRNSSVSGPTSDSTGFGTESSDRAVETTPSHSRRSALGAFFNRDRGDGWPSNFTSFGRRPTSPRPVSTHSNELPRPSADSSRWGVDGWPTGDAAAGARSSPLSFGPGFPVAQQPRMYGSRHASRRPSVQYGTSGPHEDILEDDDFDTHPAMPLPPIGTRPALFRGLDTPADDVTKLNPAAKDFKSLFASIRSKDKLKNASSERSAGPLASGTSSRDFEFEESPPNSRKSRDTRDTRSLATTESSVAESGRNSHELARTPSYTNSDAPGPSPLIGSVSSTGKESFMQKITRKSSSGKFSLPTFKREKNRLDPSSAATSPAIPPPTAEDDEESLNASVSSLGQRDTRESSRQGGRGWGNVLKIGKKKGNETPSLSSMASVDGDEADEEP